MRPTPRPRLACSRPTQLTRYLRREIDSPIWFLVVAAADDPDDLSEVATDELIHLARTATSARRRQEQAAKSAAEQQGRIIAELSRRQGWTFVRIADALGIDDSTAYRYARPFLKPE